MNLENLDLRTTLQESKKKKRKCGMVWSSPSVKYHCAQVLQASVPVLPVHICHTASLPLPHLTPLVGKLNWFKSCGSIINTV